MASPASAAPASTSPGYTDLLQMWDALLVGGWESLAVVPADHVTQLGMVVRALHESAARASSRVRVIDARGADADGSSRHGTELAAAVVAGERAVVIVDSLMRSLSGVHLLQSVNAVLLVIRVGDMDLGAIESTVGLVGPERILGSVTAPPEA